jgi:hypothetical protein
MGPHTALPMKSRPNRNLEQPKLPASWHGGVPTLRVACCRRRQQIPNHSRAVSRKSPHTRARLPFQRNGQSEYLAFQQLLKFFLACDYPPDAVVLDYLHPITPFAAPRWTNSALRHHPRSRVARSLVLSLRYYGPRSSSRHGCDLDCVRHPAPVDGLQSNWQLRNGGKQQTAYVGGSGESARIRRELRMLLDFAELVTKMSSLLCCGSPGDKREQSCLGVVYRRLLPARGGSFISVSSIECLVS